MAVISEALGRTRAAARAHRGDLFALVVIVVLVFCYFAPAIKDGPWFAPADIGRGLSNLTASSHAPPNYNDINGDIITQGVPWYLVNWESVHHGELPLWSPLIGNGMPELLNFESGTFALPSLVGYLFPVDLAFLVTMAMKLLIAGIGTYVLLRLLRARPAAALFGGVAFMFSGSLTGWLGWSISGVFCWVGFLGAGMLVCYRGTGRARELAALAVPVAFFVYGGFPEAYALAGLCLAVLVLAAACSSLLQGRRVPLAAVARGAAGGCLGLALCAPLWLAGLPVLTGSVRSGGVSAVGLPTSTAALVFAQGYDGLPTEYHASAPQAARFFGPVNYYESLAYVGVLALALVLVALVCCYRRPIVAGLAAAGAAAALVAYRIGDHDPVQHLLRLVGLGAIDTDRVLAMLGFALACLAGLGLEELFARADARARRALWGALGLLALVDLVLALRRVPALDEGDRLRALIWPTGSLVAAAVLLALFGAARRGGGGDLGRRVVGVGIVGLQAAFGLFAGVGVNSYAASPFSVTPAASALKRIVGTSLVGIDDGAASCAGSTTGICGVKGWNGEGLYPNLNVGFGIDELGLHDPVIPKATFATWPVPDAGQDLGGTNLFLPDVDTAALARDYGVSYVMARPGEPPPAGMRPVARLAGDLGTSTLYRVPRSGRFRFSVARAVVRSVREVDDADYALSVTTPVAATLRLGITAFAGWHASADGRPLAVRTGPFNLLQVRVPAGVTTITLSYWPRRLTVGFFLAGLAVAALIAWALVRRRLRSRAPRTAAAGENAAATGPTAGASARW